MKNNNAKDTPTKNNFWAGLIVGFIVSILTSIIQHTFTIKEKTIQLYLDEKKEFTNACDEFLKQYRNWHELMNYFTYEGDTSIVDFLSEFENNEQAIKKYRQWKTDFDYAYSKIFLLSDNEFGTKTMVVSTILHQSLAKMIYSDLCAEEKRTIISEIDNYFFENWLLKAQEEIFRYNSGDRKQKTITQFLSEQQKQLAENVQNDSLNDVLYEELLTAYEWMRARDSLDRKDLNYRMPTKEEFYEFVDPRCQKGK